MVTTKQKNNIIATLGNNVYSATSHLQLCLSHTEHELIYQRDSKRLLKIGVEREKE